MSTIFVILPIINVFFGHASGCAADSGSNKTGELPENFNTSFALNEASGWGGFEVPDAVKEKWKNWLLDYLQNNKLKQENFDPSKVADERGPGSGWPESWNDLGAGLSGVPPPPWAYAPINTGLPSFCYLPLNRGTNFNCDKPPEKRYAFNPYTVECVEFDYMGCGENQNNFKLQLKCEEHCMREPVSGCDPETNQYIESHDFD